MKKVVKLKAFLLWYLSDENEEGVTITDKAIDNISDNQFEKIEYLFNSCVVVPCRLVEGDESNGGDYYIGRDVILTK